MSSGIRNGTATFYTALLRTLQTGRLPFLIGGAYGFAHFTGIRRPTKDLDIFVRQDDWERVCALAAAAGWQTELTFPHWLGKVRSGADFVDVIFNSGNGVSPVDDDWFEHGVDAQVLGRAVRLAPVEESLWTKAFIMERERYDGADVAHLLRACASRIDWPRLLARFGPHWRVLLSHLVLFGFVYPCERHRIPAGVMEALLDRLRAETNGRPPRGALCQGTLLSREQYLPDVSHEGYDDVRLSPHSSMSAEDVATWTAAIAEPPDEPTAEPPAAQAPRLPTPPERGARRRRDRIDSEERTMAHPDPERANAHIPQAPDSGEKPAVMPPARTARR